MGQEHSLELFSTISPICSQVKSPVACHLQGGIGVSVFGCVQVGWEFVCVAMVWWKLRFVHHAFSIILGKLAGGGDTLVLSI